MSRSVLFVLFIFMGTGLFAQPMPDSLLRRYMAAKTDADKGKILGRFKDLISNDSDYTQRIASLIKYFDKQGDPVGRDYLLFNRSETRTGDHAAILKQALELLARFEKRKDPYGAMLACSQAGSALNAAGEWEQCIFYYKKGFQYSAQLRDRINPGFFYNSIASSYQLWGKADSGLFYVKQSIKYATETGSDHSLIYPLGTLAECYITLKQYDTAVPALRRSLQLATSYKDSFALSWGSWDLAWLYYEKDRQDSSRYYAHQTIRYAAPIRYQDMLYQAYQYLYLSHEKTGNRDSAYHYFKLYTFTKDSLFNANKTKQIEAIRFTDKTREQEAAQEKIRLRNKTRTTALLAGTAVFLLLGIILFRNNRQKQKANKVLEATLVNLKSTQSQLIQSEKMASLGELTAGIAHEIQNPLNFVNNFSEVNKELIEELKGEWRKAEGVRDTHLEEELLNDIAQNEEKINHHGKRADAIVKGMLQHSRSSSGQKEPTDINALCDEYLRLSYHGLRAKDKSFNATMRTEFDESIGKINIIPQDIGRVLLNLINNAFYACTPLPPKGGVLDPGNSVTPTVWVSTKKIADKVLISVKDNGPGIPQNILDKIFQPFFTTKPTGQGTGLGLSLSYDIVKAHGGEIRVETNEGEGTEFIVSLPSV